jgi:hypothetical protein
MKAIFFISLEEPLPCGRGSVPSRARQQAVAPHSFGLLLCTAVLCSGAVLLDRIAVTVGKDVITERAVDREIRMTAFLNGTPVDLSPESRKQAAERLIDQGLIRHDMQLSEWPQPEASEAAKLLAEFKQQHFGGNDAAYRQALERYGITQAELEQHLLWQLAALRYTDFRFQPGIPAPTKALRQHLEQQTQARSAANAAESHPSSGDALRAGQTKPPVPRTDNSGAAPSAAGQPPPGASGNIDQEMDAFLKEARSRTRIIYHEEAFQ